MIYLAFGFACFLWLRAELKLFAVKQTLNDVFDDEEVARKFNERLNELLKEKGLDR